MIVVDLNLLVYAVNEDTALHEGARRFWEQTLSRGTPVGLAWSVILGFVRLTTNPRVMPRPLTATEAFSVVDDWLAQPALRIVEPDEGHWEIVKEILAPLGTAGNLVADAHLAALAIERGATLCSTDNDFARFSRLKWSNPLSG